MEWKLATRLDIFLLCFVEVGLNWVSWVVRYSDKPHISASLIYIYLIFCKIFANILFLAIKKKLPEDKQNIMFFSPPIVPKSGGNLWTFCILIGPKAFSKHCPTYFLTQLLVAFQRISILETPLHILQNIKKTKS